LIEREPSQFREPSLLIKYYYNINIHLYSFY
jgi:hypothetical protein